MPEEVVIDDTNLEEEWSIEASIKRLIEGGYLDENGNPTGKEFTPLPPLPED